MEYSKLLDEARRLHTKSQHQDAFELLTANLDSAKYQNLLFENHPIWWSEIKAGICQLSKRSHKHGRPAKTKPNSKIFTHHPNTRLAKPTQGPKLYSKVLTIEPNRLLRN